MSKKTEAKQHLSADAIVQKIKTTVGFWRVQKWLIVYNALKYPRSSEEIAEHLAVSKSLVNKTISEYNRYGQSSIETVGKGGRKHSYLTVSEEQKFLEEFIKEAEKGRIATVNEIKQAYEKLIGKEVHKTTIYRLLKRNGWRKVVPLPQHPQSNKKAQ
jgi:transposase